MMSTLAPLVMAVCASLRSGAAWPFAFFPVNFGFGSPALSCDSMRYGASNWVSRADDTVSGRMTATLPLPIVASGLSCDMAENELLKSEAEICGTATLECELLGLFDPELLHAAATTAKLAIAAAQATFLAT